MLLTAIIVLSAQSALGTELMMVMRKFQFYESIFFWLFNIVMQFVIKIFAATAHRNILIRKILMWEVSISTSPTDCNMFQPNLLDYTILVVKLITVSHSA